MKPWIPAALIVLLLLNLAVTTSVSRGVSRLTSSVVAILAPRSSTAPSSIVSDVQSFERRPNEASLRLLEVDEANGALQPAIVERLVMVLAERELSPQLLNALIVDLARYDTTDTIRWLHELNVVARVNPTAEGPAIIRRTARACWLVLALRANFGTAGIDLTRMDLRDPAAFVGQGMNLSHIDFSSAVVSPGQWHASNLTASDFANMQVDGSLSCVGCTFDGRRLAGAAFYRGGRWAAR